MEKMERKIQEVAFDVEIAGQIQYFTCVDPNRKHLYHEQYIYAWICK